MANTIRASKNTFNGGLVMDLSPDNTPNEVLTSALNATLVTFNGNEMSLLNDMGNGRVETARLPDGYIPVGTCEFGDIIYIVSYNPLTNKSQIGCFPSPERNISTEEIGSTEQSLSSSDFLEGTIINNLFVPNGKLKASSVKKILYNNKLNPGDKFIIYDTNKSLFTNNYITDLGNTGHVYGDFPKLLKIHVVAIEDDGKIVYLDSTLRWYNKNIKISQEDNQIPVPKDYFITEVVNTGDNKPDIDSYRDMLSSGYSVFQSKVSGKLALLIELEKIKGFSCTYNTYVSKENEESEEGEEDDPITHNSSETIEEDDNTLIIYTKKCKVFWNISWETEDFNINPSYIVLTESEMTGTTKNLAGKVGYYNDSNGTYNLTFEDSSMTIPVKYNNTNTNYWWKEISLSYNMASTGTYLDFISEVTSSSAENNKSYESHLNYFINTINNAVTNTVDDKHAYSGQSLQKLNIERISDNNYHSYPRIDENKGVYYINATQAEYHGNNLIFYTQSSSDGTRMEIPSYPITDDIVNNYFHSGVYKEFAEFLIPVKQVINEIEFTPDITNLIYHYQITPAMPYGLLDEYAIDGYIDFSKIGSGKIDLTGWRYFNTENTSTLTMNIDAYTEENMGIAEIVLEFYDNQGFAAGYHITNRESFSGQFTEYIPLNAYTLNYKLSNYDNNNEAKLHAGAEITSLDGIDQAVGLIPKGQPNEGTPIQLYIHNNKAYTTVTYNEDTPTYSNEYTGKIYYNDCGTLYSNIVYLVKIVVKYCPYNALGELDTMDSSKFKTFYRWYWTNTMYNQYYYNTTDFDVLKFNLTLDLLAKYSSTNGYKYAKHKYTPSYQGVIKNNDDLYHALSANIQIISCNYTTSNNSRTYLDNLQLTIDPGLQEDFNTFSLRRSGTATPGYAEEYVSVDIITDGKLYALNVPETVDYLHAGDGNLASTILLPILDSESLNQTTDVLSYGNDRLRAILNNYMDLTRKAEDATELWSSPNSYSKFKNYFNITINSEEVLSYNTSEQYISYTQEVVPFNGKSYITKKLKEIYNNNNLGMKANIVHYSKYLPLKDNGTSGYNALVPLIQTPNDLSKYGLTLCQRADSGNYIRIANMLVMKWWNDCDGTEGHFRVWRYPITGSASDGYWYDQSSANGSWTADYGDPDDFSIYANNSKHQFYEYNNTQWHNFIEATPGFLLTTFATPDSDYDWRGFFVNNINCARKNPQNFNWDFYRMYLLDPWTYPIGNYIDPDQEYNLGLWNNNKRGRVLANISFLGDKNNAFHFLNNWAIIADTTDVHSFARNSTWGLDQNGNNNFPPYPWYIGDALASVLASIYVYTQGGTMDVTYDSDVVYLADNYTVFTKDIVYKMYVNNPSVDLNTLINISGIAYNEYLELVFNNSGINNNDISSDNVNVTLLTMIKNCPLQLRVNYIIPDFGSLGNKGTIKTIAYPIHGESIELESLVQANTLYYIKNINGKQYALVLDLGFTPTFYELYYIDLGILKAYSTVPYYSNIVFPDVYNTFEYTEGTLKIKKSVAPASGLCYSLVTKEEGWYTIFDIYKNDAVFPYLKLW